MIHSIASGSSNRLCLMSRMSIALRLRIAGNEHVRTCLPGVIVTDSHAVTVGRWSERVHQVDHRLARQGYGDRVVQYDIDAGPRDRKHGEVSLGCRLGRRKLIPQPGGVVTRRSCLEAFVS